MESAPRYEIVDTIATGDFAVVYRARDRELGREVAIKQINLPFNTVQGLQDAIHAGVSGDVAAHLPAHLVPLGEDFRHLLHGISDVAAEVWVIEDVELGPLGPVRLTERCRSIVDATVDQELQRAGLDRSRHRARVGC